MEKRYWTDHEVLVLKVFSEIETAEEIAKRLNRSYASVHCKCQKMKIKTIRKNKKHVWTKEKVEYLKKYAGKIKTRTMCKYLGCTYQALKHKASKLGISIRIEKVSWSDSQLTTLFQMKSEGKSYKEISQAVGKSPNACKCKWAYLKP